MTMIEKCRISLTGPGSHLLVRRPGVGSLHVGPPGSGADLHVDPAARIDWSVFDALTTPAGDPWPRYLTYTGDDDAVLAWTRERPAEGLRVAPLRDADWDASGSRIRELSLVSHGPRIRIRLPAPSVLRHLTLHGDPARFTIVAHPDGLPASVALVLPDAPTADRMPAPASGAGGARALPPLPALAGVTALTVIGGPLDRPLDCRSLGRFPALHSLDLRGALAHPEALARLPLAALELRYVPDLAGLPPLDTWPALTRLIAWNIDEAGGRQLRRQLRALPAGRLSDHSGVSRLRSRRWFVEEYGLPFSGWPARAARPATKAFRTAAAAAAAATGLAEAERAITGFVGAVNALPGIETGERDDAATAVALLAALAGVPVAEQQALTWFDAARDF
ncbi:hypothetical protein GCM10020358_37050 [Amorphoplanes nipponensis]|uniref:Uncharacterized protein n=1 Tax=Actinoplanes nipponensis TaxID=135950 RepID=A0A919JR08_9ACTN|nr:hypothetical protein [Actinoplanes nipponensis]GIE53875.1 hypothetical protein Ani05nite_74090 [Actinoplanes nipponensis]